MAVDLRELARAAGIDPEYTNWQQKPWASSDEALLQTLAALGPDLGIAVRTPDDAPTAIAALEHARWAEVAPPVVVGWDGAVIVPFSVVADRDGDWELEVKTEGGGTSHARGRLFELPADSHTQADGAVRCIRRASIHVGEHGYHSLRWRAAGAAGEALAICAPLQAWHAPGSGPRRWGVFAPVYGLASQQSGAAGDLATLRELFEMTARRGGTYVATLPMLAAFLGEPCSFSPYSPASRLYWNDLYLDLEALAAQVGMPAPTAPPVSDALIDYRAQYKWRRPALDAFAARLFADPARAAAIEAWGIEAGAYDYAAFRAVGERSRAGWRNWRAEDRDGVPFVRDRAAAIAFAGDPVRVDSHVVAQWAMQRQLESLGPAQLYLDLPVGVSADAYEVWRWRDQFILELAAGAPPDALFLGGQDWGLPPLSPIALRRDRYRYFIACVRHHMRIAGMLRVDHVMGLFRMYCIPHGRPATDGVYVRYRADELLAILVLESQRARCALAGEDLGTVPDFVRPAMARHGMYRLHVGQWSMPMHVGDAPGPAPAPSVASLNTHDTPTFAGWWGGHDIVDKRDLELIDDAQVLAERAERAQQRAALLAFAGSAHPELSDAERAMIAATADLAAGPAEVALVSLDDLALDPVPHNVPGTTTQRSNWQRRVTGWATALDPDRASPAAAAAIAAVVAARST